MLKHGGNTLRDALLNLYNEVIQPTRATPTQWRQTQFTVIYKSGDPQLPQNYRPIAVIPLLYKLFSRLLYNRLETTLDSQQPPEQAGFRRHFSTDDHLFTFSLIQEAANEWQLPLWIATIDFKKAFDTVSHTSLVTALHEQGVSDNYIHLLTRLYTDQTGRVKTDVLSKEFRIERGTKQGDPLSSMLFNSLSESIFRRLQHKWQKRGCGLRLQAMGQTTLTNLRFADDVLVFATTLPQLKAMIRELADEAWKAGLELHPDKTKILHNVTRRRPRQQPEYVNIGHLNVEVLRSKSTQKYLGRKITFTAPHQTEVENRIAGAWRKFHLLKQELTTNKYNLNDRLRLFQGTITPTLLYGCSCWTMTLELENRLRRTQRQMIRMIIATPRRRLTCTMTSDTIPNTSTTTQHNYNYLQHDDARTLHPPSRQDNDFEPWIDWLRRCTHNAEQKMRSLGMEDWVSTQRRRKWRWAQRVATDTFDKWTLKAALWDPTLDATHNPRRRPGRPVTRWVDDIVGHLTRSTTKHNTNEPQMTETNNERLQWFDVAQDNKTWLDLEDSYVNRNYDDCFHNGDDDGDDDDVDNRCLHDEADGGHRVDTTKGHHLFTDTVSADSCGAHDNTTLLASPRSFAGTAPVDLN